LGDIHQACDDLTKNKDIEVARARAGLFATAARVLSVELQHAKLSKRVEPEALSGVTLRDD
jgi:hypothetical protein